MSFLHSQHASQPKTESNPLRLTISEMKFKPQLQHRNSIQSQRVINSNQSYLHSASHQLLPRAMSYRSEKEKRMRRLKQQPNGFRLEENLLQESQSQMLKTWNTSFFHFQHKNGQIQTAHNYQIEPIKSELSQRLSSKKKLPTIKYDIDIKRRKNESAKRDLKPSPAELLTRKLEWQGRAKKVQNPQKLPRSKPKTSNPTKIPFLHQRYKQKHTFLKLSGWQLQHSHQYALGQFHC